MIILCAPGKPPHHDEAGIVPPDTPQPFPAKRHWSPQSDPFGTLTKRPKFLRLAPKLIGIVSRSMIQYLSRRGSLGSQPISRRANPLN